MKQYFLNGEVMNTRAAAHAEIAREMQFPDYYGKNLDALWDLISDMEAEVHLRHAAAMLNALGPYGCKLLATFYEADAKTNDFHFQAE